MANDGTSESDHVDLSLWEKSLDAPPSFEEFLITEGSPLDLVAFILVSSIGLGILITVIFK